VRNQKVGHELLRPTVRLYYTIHSANMGKQLVVFDFDWSFVDQDTDRWVFEVLSTELRRLLQDRKKGQGTGIQCTPDVV
jgi:hypothetical protein